ncbi:MAG: ABC transporter permease [Chthoniobacterales bacterium]|nr:MAG: ABC transporter permease [Chthoniobacterales bacterium]
MMTDIRYGIRQLLKHPGFTLVAVLTLALGIGANTAIFSVVNAVLLKPLPFPAPEQLVAMGGVDLNATASPPRLDSLCYPDFFDFREQNRSFSSMAIYRNRTLALVDEKGAQSVSGEKVSGEFFDVLDIKPMLGRAFGRADEQAGGGPGGLKVVASYGFWQSHFNHADDVIGRVLMLDGRPHTVIGVMPQGFQFPIQTESIELYTTIAEDASTPDGSTPITQQRGSHGLEGIARVQAGVPLAQANLELRTIAAVLEKKYPDTNTKFSAGSQPLRDEMVGDVRTALYVLFGAVACLLLIANANVANLMLARASVRGKEIALRAALGASRGRIVRQLLTESVLLAGLGGLLGLVVAQWGTEALVAAVPQNIPRVSAIRLDGAVLGFTLLLSLVTGIVFGLVPAWQASHVDLNTALKSGTRGAGGVEGKHRVRNALVMTEVALALILLICASLLIQTFARLGRVQTGMKTERLFTARIGLPEAAYPKPESIIAFFDQLMPRLRTIPGVESVTAVWPLPLSGSNNVSSFDIEERPMPEGQQPDSPMRIVGPDYFKTMGIPVRQGRGFEETDQFKSLPVVIVNEQFVQKFFPGQSVVGKHIKPSWGIGDEKPLMRTIVGVVGNVKHRTLSMEFTPEVYMSTSQIPMDNVSIVARTSVSNAAAITSAVRSELAALDRNIPLVRVRVFDEYLARALARPRFNALLLSIFAGTALLLTAIGIYGVMAYSVSQRTSEIGIRIALGAGKRSIFRLVVGQAMTIVALSLVVGIVGALAATRLLNSLLFGIGASDPVTFIAIVLLVSAVAFIAAWLPARRATRVDPIIALRAE